LLYADTSTRRLSLAEHWHRLSLDAPTVAFVWSCFFARAAHLNLPSFTPFLLALGTWIVYVADRLLDGLDTRTEGALRERHRFYARHRGAFSWLLAAAILVCGVLAFTRMRHDVLDGNALLGVFLGAYFALIHGSGKSVERWLPKELVVGCLFAAATALPTLVRVPDGKRFEVSVGVSLFAALCWLNCVAIESWETEHAAAASTRDSFPFGSPHFTTRWAGKHLGLTAIVVTAISAGCAMVWIEHFTGRVALACFMASLCLALLDHFSQRLGAGALRVAADISLLTPLLVLPWITGR
jgi:hypothetical protein